ncbi:NifU family protein [Streptosporangium saharense]|uniref:NifU family protein n=1 Tax=Streptosporangium saharense TaxID=1706840 RepID=UPI00343DA359
MSATTDAQATGERVEELLAELAALGDPVAHARAEELVRVLVGLYGTALERVMEIVTEEEAAGVLRRVTSDPLLCGLLAVHDLHPLDTGERVRLALEEVRPHLGSHAGDVELLAVEEETGVVRLRLRGACDGCPSSRITVRDAIERAVTRAAPEVARVEVEGVHDDTLLQIAPGPCPVPEPGAGTVTR